MKEKNKKLQVWVIIICIVIITVFFLISQNQSKTTGSDEKWIVKEIQQTSQGEDTTPEYCEVLESYGTQKDSAKECEADFKNIQDDQNQNIQLSTYLQQSGVLWNQNESTSYKIPITCEAGLYSIQVSYIPTKESDMDIVMRLSMDGKVPFKELETVELPRSWVAESENYYDDKGNEYASYLVQQEILLTSGIRDREGIYSDDLLLELDEGQHMLEMEYVSGSMLIVGVRLVPKTILPNYETYKALYEGNAYTGKSIMIQAENPDSRSLRDIPSYTHNDASMTPYTPGKTRINALGGGYWYEGNASVTWSLDVPEDGWYKLAVRFIADHESLTSYRQILIDDKVPFQEVDAYAFEHTSKFQTEAIGKDEPYLFYLTEGTHTLTMRAVVGKMDEPIRHLQELGKAVSATVKDIQMITGTSPDPNFDYELDKKMPELLDELELYRNNLLAISDEITDICGTTPAVTATLYSDAEMLASMIKNVRKIPENISLLTTMQGNVNDAASTLKSQPLGIDWISLQNPADELYQPKASLIDKVKLTASDFITSFEKEDENTSEEEQTINLWVARDREWGNILQRMISEEFEPKYGIKVNVNVLPSGNTTVVSGASPLLLSVVAGNTPDIAMGCDSKTPIELAIRDQLADLSQFSDFQEVTSRFPETTIESLSYENGCYGLPETMEVPIMVYRTDIFEQNGLEVPNTWEELWRYTLPQLAQIDGNFYMGSSSTDMYAQFLYQNGGNFYNEDGSCALNSDAAIKAFEQWTKCFVQYNVPQSASFYNEMRTGTIPIGICSLNDYMQLLTYAGELTGKLGVAPIPGTMSEDGTNVRYGAGSISSAIVFKDSTKQEECWTFLKWWTSEDVQSRFARGVEARVGATGRWFSANLEAFYELPWEQKVVGVLKEWMPWYRNMYNVLGGYYTSRSITNAWTRTVMSGVDSRDSIEQSYEEISTQIERKREEYGQ